MVDAATLEKLEAGFKKLQASDSKSLLKKYLTQEVFDKLKTVKTPTFGSSLLDVIQSGKWWSFTLHIFHSPPSVAGGSAAVNYNEAWEVRSQAYNLIIIIICFNTGCHKNPGFQGYNIYFNNGLQDVGLF